MSLIISFDSRDGNIHADNHGRYNLTIFGFITGYNGLTTLTVYENNMEKTYTGLTNELGAVGFCVSGTLPEGEHRKNFPVLISTPYEQQKSYFTVKTD